MSSKTPQIIVVGLGPADESLLIGQTREFIRNIPHRYVRTNRHPAVSVFDGEVTSFDAFYETATSIDEVYKDIVTTLLDAAREFGTILYAVPGSPLVAEHTVQLLLDNSQTQTNQCALNPTSNAPTVKNEQNDDHRIVDLLIIPALSFLDLTWTKIGVDPVAAQVSIIDGHQFDESIIGKQGPFFVAQCDTKHVLSDIKLFLGEVNDWYADTLLLTDVTGTRNESSINDIDQKSSDILVTILHHIGLPDEKICIVPWYELDYFEPDHLTSVWVPKIPVPLTTDINNLGDLVVALRAGCPWDAQQTHASLKRYLLEETYELLDAIDELDDLDNQENVEHFIEELGDILFQVIFHTTIAQESELFTLSDVISNVYTKLWKRHPHVFIPSDKEVSAQEVTQKWEENKKVEKQRESIFDGIPPALPALLFASKVVKKSKLIFKDRAVLTPENENESVLSTSSKLESAEEQIWQIIEQACIDGIDLESRLRTFANRKIREVKDYEANSNGR